MAAQSSLIDSRNRAFIRLKKDIESVKDPQGKQIYTLNNEDGARKDGLRNIVAAQSNIISILPINSATTQYVFNIKDGVPNANNANILPMECRLKDQDVFYTSSLGFFLTCFNNNGYTPIRFQYWTYPSPGLQSPLPGVADIAALNGIWQSGFLEVKVNGVVVTPKWWLGKHEYVPQTQTNLGGVPINPFWDEQDYSGDGYIVTEPNWVLNGGNNNQYTVSYGSDWGLVLNPASTVQLGLIMVWDGWLAQNASSIMYNQPAK